MEKLGVFIIMLLACSVLGVGLVFMSSGGDEIFTYKWQEIFKNSMYFAIGVFFHAYLNRLKVTACISMILGIWCFADLIFEIYFYHVPFDARPSFHSVSVWLIWTFSFLIGVSLMLFFNKTETGNKIKSFFN